MKTYLILLVGLNPLPNYISALKNIDESTEVYLVYTKDSEENLGTEKIAFNLENLLMKRFNDRLIINMIDIDKSHPLKIDHCIDNRILKDIINKNEVGDEYKVILDYTGSTKILASKFYSKVKEFEIKNKNQKLRVGYSYVDAASGDIKIKKAFLEEENYEEVILEVDEILELHGFFVDRKEEEKIFVKDINNQIIELEDLKVNKHYLECTFNSVNKANQKSNISNVKLDLFRSRDYSVKIGGEQAITILKTNISEADKIKLEKDFNSSTFNYVKDRVKIK